MQLATPDGRGRSGVSGGRGQILAENASTAESAESLSLRLGRPVIDETGLKGGFNFEIKLATDLDEAEKAAMDDTLSLFTVLQERLGLKLMSKKGAAKMLIIDHLEKTPSDN